MTYYYSTNAGNPRIRHWFADVGTSNGQWYLTLDPANNGTWVLKPFDNSIAKFVSVNYMPSRPVGGIVLVQQQDVKGIQSVDSAEKTGLSANSRTALAARNLSGRLFDAWIPADSRFFVAKPIVVGGYVLESLWFAGRYMTFDPKNIKGNSSTPVFLDGQHRGWENQIFRARDYGNADGTHTVIMSEDLPPPPGPAQGPAE